MKAVNSKQRLRPDLVIFNLLAIFWLTLLHVFFGNQGIESMQLILLSAVIGCMIIAYVFGLRAGIVISAISILAFGAYLYFRVSVVGAVFELRLDYVTWIVAVPLGGLLASSLSGRLGYNFQHKAGRDGAANLSTIDEHTGLLNRRGIFLRIEEEAERAKRFTSNFCIMLVTIPHFPEVRATYGKEGIAQIYKAVIHTIAQHTRSIDTKGILSEDTFVLILPATCISEASIPQERLRRHLRAVNLSAKGKEIAVELRAKVGKAQFIMNDSAEELIGKARVNGEYDMG